jgi:hypothetical protein
MFATLETHLFYTVDYAAGHNNSSVMYCSIVKFVRLKCENVPIRRITVRRRGKVDNFTRWLFCERNLQFLLEPSLYMVRKV